MNDGRYSLKDFYVGQSDGKKEALYKKDFENYFYDYNGIYKTATTDKTFLILGRKGTGKSILAEFLHKQSLKEPNWFCQICSYKEFKFHELTHLKNNDVKPNEYITIWEWVILLELGKMCLNDNKLNDFDQMKKFKEFMSNSFSSLNLNANRILEITKSKKIAGHLLKFSGEYNSSVKYTTGSYLEYI